jgi:hypothetical protein
MAHVLKSLDLSYNELDEIPFEALQPLTSLDWINFHRYGFSFQILDTFWNLLETKDLNYWQILLN